MLISKKTSKRLGLFVLILFVLINIVAYFHAYKFTHFSSSATTKTKDGTRLSFLQKVGAVLFGINNPRPVNTVIPTQNFKTIKLNSNKQIECWLINVPKNPKGTVILFHGYSGQKSSMLDKANEFLKLGFNTLLVDFMGSGGSQGNQTTLGFYEADEVKTAFDYISAQGEKTIFLFGTSMGAVAIMKAQSNYRLNVTGIIIECPFGSMLQTVQARFNTMHLPTFPMANLLVFWGGLQNNFNAFKHNPSEYAKKINCPTLLLYGEKDEKVSRAEIDTIYKNLQGYKELKTYPLAAHENYLTKYKNEWEYDIGSFMWHITRFNQSTCLHTDLSKQFNFQTKIQRLPTVDGFDSSIAQVNIIDKATGKNTQTINYYSNYFFDDVFNNCNSCRSYTTGKNVNDIIADNNFGDILVADFNFDHKEDVALKHDSGGNGGPMYDFYLQAPDGKFYIDKYLSDSMRYFPVYFNPTNKTLATQVHANAYGENKNTFKFNPKTNTWQYIVSEFIEANK